MWIVFALLAALFSGLTTICAKKGVKNVDSILASSIRTAVVLLISFLIVILFSSFDRVNFKTIAFLILSGASTTLLWLNYFKALDLGNVNEVTPVDKTSIVLTLILSCIFLNEKITVIKIISSILIISGAFLMVNKKEHSNNKRWIKYAILTAIFTSVSAIISKIGLRDIEPNLGNLYRTIFVFIFMWLIVLLKKKQKHIKTINKKSWLYLILSGITTSLSWIYYFNALKEGEASIVFPIEKLSVVVSIGLSYILLKERMTKKSIIGLILIVAGTYILII